MPLAAAARNNTYRPGAERHLAQQAVRGARARETLCGETQAAAKAAREHGQAHAPLPRAEAGDLGVAALERAHLVVRERRWLAERAALAQLTAFSSAACARSRGGSAQLGGGANTVVADNNARWRERPGGGEGVNMSPSLGGPD